MVTSKPSIAAWKRVDGIDLGDDDARAEAAQRMRAAFADVAVAADDGHLAGDHDVGGALDAVGERFAAAVEIVELRFGDRVVDVDGRARAVCPLPASGRGDGRRWSFLRETPRQSLTTFVPETGALLGARA